MPQNGQNAYLVMKNPNAHLAHLGSLCSHDSAMQSRQKGPNFQFGFPPLQKAGYGPVLTELSWPAYAFVHMQVSGCVLITQVQIISYVF